jgi:hypothetical protein
MKKNNTYEILTVLIMTVLVYTGYKYFCNTAFTGHEARGTHIWLSASTVKFVNNWLKEGPFNLHFLMLEYPDSIEFNNLSEREVYISYPPGAVIPPYILAKLLHKPEIQIGFIKQFLKIKFLLDVLLVCFIFYSVFRRILRRKNRKATATTAVILSICWMLMPINLYYLRNVYFSDQCVISVVLLFFLLEIYDSYFSAKTIKSPLRCVYFVFKFFISLFGVLTDYYFLFVLFISWLVKIVPLFKAKYLLKNIISSSLVYVLPVLLGIGLFISQIMAVPNSKSIVINKMKYRMFSDSEWHGGNKIIAIAKSLAENYYFGTMFVIAFIFMLVFLFAKNRNNKTFTEKYRPLFDFALILYIPPVLQVLVLQQHSAVHEFSLLKFSFPIIASVVWLVVLYLELKGMENARFVIQIENDKRLHKIKITAVYLLSIAGSVLLCSIPAVYADYYYEARKGEPVSYERENLIRANDDFNDVYFSFTESIEANPPQFLAVSRKLIHKIDNLANIGEMFPHLKPSARILLVVNKNNRDKPKNILENEQNAVKDGVLFVSSQNYDIYEIPRRIDQPPLFSED